MTPKPYDKKSPSGGSFSSKSIFSNAANLSHLSLLLLLPLMVMALAV
ncbi:MAG: hypothetical protein H0V82_12750 [Candidatus Protochlamydia sp.]|nr:hypothetical protein [Candidatus Protochlamydia sp.]